MLPHDGSADHNCAVPYPGLDLSGRTAVVLGATSGIGLAIARGLAQAGANVVATGRRQSLVDEAADVVEALGRRSLRVTSDVTHAASIEALRSAVVDSLGSVDRIVNCTGSTSLQTE